MDSLAPARYAAILRECGMSAQDIADVSGIAVTLVRRLLKPPQVRPARVARTTSEAILGVPLPARPFAGRGFVDAAPAAKRLVDLASRGWTANRLAAFLAVHPGTVYALREGSCVRTSIAIDARVKAVHQALLDADPAEAGIRPGDSTRARRWADRQAGACLPFPSG